MDSVPFHRDIMEAKTSSNGIATTMTIAATTAPTNEGSSNPTVTTAGNTEGDVRPAVAAATSTVDNTDQNMAMMSVDGAEEKEEQTNQDPTTAAGGPVSTSNTTIETITVTASRSETLKNSKSKDEVRQPLQKIEEKVSWSRAEVNADASSSSFLSKMQLAAVDEAFQKLFGYPWGTRFVVPDPEMVEELLSPRQQILCQVLGPHQAASLLRLAPMTTTRTHSSSHPYSKKTSTRDKPWAYRKHQNYKYSLPSSSNYRPIQEIVSDLDTGNEQAQQQFPAASAAGAAAPTAAAAAAGVLLPPRSNIGGMDQLLAEMNATGKTSTVAKTSADWDHFKTVSGLADKIETQAESKHSFLKRQEFLTRVDHRQFEHERAQRERSRLSEQAQSAPRR